MLSNIQVKVLELIVVNELCEFKGREKLADIIITPIVRTTPNIPKQRCCCC